jgi:hypothetical protein
MTKADRDPVALADARALIVRQLGAALAAVWRDEHAVTSAPEQPPGEPHAHARDDRQERKDRP